MGLLIHDDEAHSTLQFRCVARTKPHQPNLLSSEKSLLHNASLFYVYVYLYRYISQLSSPQVGEGHACRWTQALDCMLVLYMSAIELPRFHTTQTLGNICRPA